MNPDRKELFDIHPGATFMATIGDCQFQVAIFRINPLTRRVRTVEYDQDGNSKWQQGAIGSFSLKALQRGRYGAMRLHRIT